MALGLDKLTLDQLCNLSLESLMTLGMTSGSIRVGEVRLDPFIAVVDVVAAAGGALRVRTSGGGVGELQLEGG